MVLCRVLSFLAFLLHDLSMLMARRKRASLDPSLIMVGSISLQVRVKAACVSASSTSRSPISLWMVSP